MTPSHPNPNLIVDRESLKPSNSGELELAIKGNVLRPISIKFIQMSEDALSGKFRPSSLKDAETMTEAVIEVAWKRVEALFAQTLKEKEVEARIHYERSGMAFVHATVVELSDDKKLLSKLDSIVQDKLAALTASLKEKQ